MTPRGNGPVWATFSVKYHCTKKLCVETVLQLLLGCFMRDVNRYWLHVFYFFQDAKKCGVLCVGLRSIVEIDWTVLFCSCLFFWKLVETTWIQLKCVQNCSPNRNEQNSWWSLAHPCTSWLHATVLFVCSAPDLLFDFSFVNANPYEIASFAVRRVIKLNCRSVFV